MDFIEGLFGISGKVAVVTGAGDGLGQAISLGLARAGAAVVAVDQNEEGARNTSEEIANSGGNAMAVGCDVSNSSHVDHLFQVVDKRFNDVHILVNNAGINPVSDVPENFPLDGWQRTLDVNLTGPFLCSRAAGRRMIDHGHGGSIVNISSINGSSASGRGLLGFGASKAGLNQLTRDLAIEWARRGIRVNAIQPCQFLTRGWRAAVADRSNDELVSTVLHGIPLGRMGEPSEIVGPVLFLASDAASMVTGVILPVDGGNLAMNAGAGGTMPMAKRS